MATWSWVSGRTVPCFSNIRFPFETQLRQNRWLILRSIKRKANVKSNKVFPPTQLLTSGSMNATWFAFRNLIILVSNAQKSEKFCQAKKLLRSLARSFLCNIGNKMLCLLNNLAPKNLYYLYSQLSFSKIAWWIILTVNEKQKTNTSEDFSCPRSKIKK